MKCSGRALLLLTRLGSIRLVSTLSNSSRLNPTHLDSVELVSTQYDSSQLCRTRLDSIRLVSTLSNSSRLNPTRLDSVELMSTQSDSSRLCRTRLDSIRLVSTLSGVQRVSCCINLICNATYSAINPPIKRDETRSRRITMSQSVKSAHFTVHYISQRQSKRFGVSHDHGIRSHEIRNSSLSNLASMLQRVYSPARFPHRNLADIACRRLRHRRRPWLINAPPTLRVWRHLRPCSRYVAYSWCK